MREPRTDRRPDGRQPDTKQPDRRPEAKAEKPRRALGRRDGALPAERLPLILEVAPDDDVVEI